MCLFACLVVLMSDFGEDSCYGDDVSIPESVGSYIDQEKAENEKHEDADEAEMEPKDAFTGKIYEIFRRCIFQDASNDKIYILKFIKSK